MANEQNLMPIQEVNSRRTPEQHSADSRKAGIQSGVARRRKRTLKQAAELVMSLPVSDPKTRTKLKKMGIDIDDADNQMAVIVGLMGRAMNGEPKASALLFELLDDHNTSANEQMDSHNALIDAIRKRNNED